MIGSSMMERVAIVRALGMVVAIGLNGCDHTQADCRQLVGRINDAVDALHGQRLAGRGDPRELADRMHELGTSMREHSDRSSATRLRTPALVTERDAHVSTTRQIAEAAGRWADALDELLAARNRGEEAMQALDANLNRLESICDGSTCFEVMRLLGASARRPGGTPELLEALADSLEDAETDLAEVNAAVAVHVRQLRALANALEMMEEAERAAQRAEADLTAAARHEDAIVERINAICTR